MRTFDLDQFWPSLQHTAALDKAPSGPDAAVRPVAPSTPAFDRRIAIPDRAFALHDSAPQTESGFFHSLAPASAVARRRSRSVRAFMRTFDPQAAAWLSLGFMAGMVAWHAVGFWGFVSHAVLNGEPRSSSILIAAKRLPPTTPAAPLITGSLPSFKPQPNACLNLILDRETGSTLTNTCRIDDQPLRDAGRRQRGDRMPVPLARIDNTEVWTSATTAVVPEAGPTPSIEPVSQISASDFDLSLTDAP